jgi:hypothetical protein
VSSRLTYPLAFLVLPDLKSSVAVAMHVAGMGSVFDAGVRIRAVSRSTWHADGEGCRDGLVQSLEVRDRVNGELATYLPSRLPCPS